MARPDSDHCGFAEFASSFGAGWIARRERGEVNEEEFTRLLMDAWRQRRAIESAIGHLTGATSLPYQAATALAELSSALDETQQRSKPWCDVCKDKGGPGPLDPCPECNRYGDLPDGGDAPREEQYG